LAISAARDDAQTVQMLFAAGAKLEPRNVEGYTPLMAAVKEDAVGSAEALLKLGANANAADSEGNTALLLAVGKGYPQGLALTRLLIAHGADLKGVRGGE
jgi:ankyrin repeat protein